jgi:hypothetical protein
VGVPVVAFTVGREVGAPVDALIGAPVGATVGFKVAFLAVGSAVGSEVAVRMVGGEVENSVGSVVGSKVVSLIVGGDVDNSVGSAVGSEVVLRTVGGDVDNSVGSAVGSEVALRGVGDDVRASVGLAVGSKLDSPAVGVDVDNSVGSAVGSEVALRTVGGEVDATVGSKVVSPAVGSTVTASVGSKVGAKENPRGHDGGRMLQRQRPPDDGARDVPTSFAQLAVYALPSEHTKSVPPTFGTLTLDSVNGVVHAPSPITNWKSFTSWLSLQIQLPLYQLNFPALPSSHAMFMLHVAVNGHREKRGLQETHTVRPPEWLHGPRYNCIQSHWVWQEGACSAWMEEVDPSAISIASLTTDLALRVIMVLVRVVRSVVRSLGSLEQFLSLARSIQSAILLIERNGVLGLALLVCLLVRWWLATTCFGWVVGSVQSQRRWSICMLFFVPSWRGSCRGQQHFATALWFVCSWVATVDSLHCVVGVNASSATTFQRKLQIQNTTERNSAVMKT